MMMVVRQHSSDGDVDDVVVVVGTVEVVVVRLQVERTIDVGGGDEESRQNWERRRSYWEQNQMTSRWMET